MGALYRLLCATRALCGLPICCLLLSHCVMGASAILCYQCTGCDADYETTAAKCEGDTCMRAFGTLEGNAYDTRMCLKNVRGIQMGCVTEELTQDVDGTEAKDTGSLCYCNDQDFCNTAATVQIGPHIPAALIAVALGKIFGL